MSAWARRSSMNDAGNRGILSRLFLELRHRDPAAPLFGRRTFEPDDHRVVLEEPGDGAPQLARAVAVDEADGAPVGQQALVEELLGARQGLVHRAADEVEFRRAAVARLD